jgi:hypothetical protein
MSTLRKVVAQKSVCCPLRQQQINCRVLVQFRITRKLTNPRPKSNALQGAARQPHFARLLCAKAFQAYQHDDSFSYIAVLGYALWLRDISSEHDESASFHISDPQLSFCISTCWQGLGIIDPSYYGVDSLMVLNLGCYLRARAGGKIKCVDSLETVTVSSEKENNSTIVCPWASFQYQPSLMC